MPTLPASQSRSAEAETLVDDDAEPDGGLTDEICLHFLSQFAQEALDANYVFTDGHEHAWMILRWIMHCTSHSESEIQIFVDGLSEEVRHDLVDFVAVRAELMESVWSERYICFIRLTSP